MSPETEMSEEMRKYKDVIDRMSYKSMLKRNRFAPVGDAMFMGEVGVYFQEVMAAKEGELEPGEKTAISKEIGWEK